MGRPVYSDCGQVGLVVGSWAAVLELIPQAEGAAPGSAAMSEIGRPPFSKWPSLFLDFAMVFLPLT